MPLTLTCAEFSASPGTDIVGETMGYCVEDMDGIPSEKTGSDTAILAAVVTHALQLARGNPFTSCWLRPTR